MHVEPRLRHFYQAEVLVPSPLPPDLIIRAEPLILKQQKREVRRPVQTDEKVPVVLRKPDPARVEVARNGSVANRPLVVAGAGSTAAKALPYTCRTPPVGESKRQLDGCLSELVVPAPLLKEESIPLTEQELVAVPIPLFTAVDVQLCPPVDVPYVKRVHIATPVKCVMKPDGLCSCGDTGCDGPVLFVESLLVN